MTDAARLLRALRLPPRRLVQRAGAKAAAAIRRARDRAADRRRATYVDPAAVPAGALHARLPAPPVHLLTPAQLEALAGVTAEYLAHRFDLLGSGWRAVAYGARCPGLEGHRYGPGPAAQPDPAGRWLEPRIPAANAPYSRAVWALVDAAYVPIDWQLDWKSGYRWSERTWHGDIRFAPVPGADVKLPWELARAQHLPQLALAHAAARAGLPGFGPAERYAREVRNQILDFIAANPPRFGVNWSMPMDVAIRVANWLVAWDLLRAAGAELDGEFEAVLRRSVYEHGLHLATHLEWLPELRGNHYLADVVGLLFAAAYLPRRADTDAWLALAVQELGAEIPAQFLADGGNFEASTVYHRLSAEIALYGAALVLGLDEPARAVLRRGGHRWRVRGPRFSGAPLAEHAVPGIGRAFLSAECLARLEHAVAFTAAITKPDGRVPQVGDNDSGRFLRLTPAYRRLDPAAARATYANLAADAGREAGGGTADATPYWDEDPLDHAHLIGAGAGLFGRPAWAMPATALETALVRALSGGRGPAPAVLPATTTGAVGSPGTLGGLAARADATPADTRTFRFHVGAEWRAAVEAVGFPAFGLYVFRSPRVYLAIRCGAVGQHGIGGHAHNDQLALELMVDGVDRVRDPGSYLYTPLPARRNAYRSVHAHFAPATVEEPGRLDQGLFRLAAALEGEVLYFGPEGFAGALRLRGGATVQLLVHLEADGIRIEHRAVGARLAPVAQPPYSPGYGKVLRAP